MQQLKVFGKLMRDLKNARIKAAKIQLLAAFAPSVNTFNARLWLYCLNPYITYGISGVPKSIPTVPVDGDIHYPTDEGGFIALLNDLATRVLSGHRAKRAVYNFYEALPKGDTRWAFEAIISRKPRCGINAATLNKVHKDWIPTFTVQRADRWNENNARSLINKHGAFVEPKLDGERRIYIHSVDGTPSKLLSRKGTEDTSFPYIINYLDQYTPPGTVLDGEIVYGQGLLGSRQDFQHYYGSKTVNNPDCPCRFVVFDIMSLDSWTRQECLTSQFHRRQQLISLLSDSTKHPAYVSYCKNVSSFDQYMEFHYDLIEKGFEGSILKDLTSPYICKHTAAKHWIKHKYEETEEVTLLECLPGEHNTKYQHTLGKFRCKRVNGVELLVGRGRMSDETADDIWLNRHCLTGRLMEIMHGGETQDKSLCHPRFLCWRLDKHNP